MAAARQDHRRAVAERSVEAILGAAERLLAEGGDASTSAVAAAAGVSRVTLYAHFPTRGNLLEAIAERAIARNVAAIEAAALAEGSAADALDRLIEAAWAALQHHRVLFNVARQEFSNATLLKAHRQIDAPILSLIERGRRDGTFRKDVPNSWQLACYYALMHAGADEVIAGRLGADAAVSTLKKTIGQAFAASSAPPGGSARAIPHT